VNISAYIFAILKRLVEILAFILKGIIFIGKLKNKYHVLIVVNLYLLLVANAYYMLEIIMLSNFMAEETKRNL
jgi:hypothetical protein